jgi:hypothetical protein
VAALSDVRRDVAPVLPAIVAFTSGHGAAPQPVLRRPAPAAL